MPPFRANLPHRAIAWGLFVAGVAIAITIGPGFRQFYNWFTEFIRSAGGWGPVILAIAYIPAAVFLVPGSVMTLLAGWAFGIGRGLAAVSLGSTLGACAAFLISRYAAREWVESRLARRISLLALDEAVAREGFRLVVLIRLSPVLPYVLTNYLLGLTRIRLRTFALASWLGMLPGGLLYVYLGSATRDIADVATGNAVSSPWTWVAMGVGLAATAAIGIILARLASRTIRRHSPALGPQELR